MRSDQRTVISPAHGALLDQLATRTADYAPVPLAWHKVASPLVLDEDRLTADLAAIDRICTLIDRHVSREVHRLPRHLDDLVAADVGLGTEYFARPDCILEDGRLKVLELNISTGTINISANVASRLYFQAATPYPGFAGNLTERAVDEALADVLRNLGQGDRIGLWFHDASPDALRRVADVCEILGAHDVKAVPVPTREAAGFRGPLYGYFSTIHLLGPDGPELADVIRQVLRRGSRPALVRPTDLIRHLKAGLAILYELATQGALSDEDAEIVVAHVPETRVVNASVVAELRGAKDEWVLKPDASFKAKGVVVGRDATPDEWERALQASGPMIAQRLVVPDQVPMLYERDGVIERIDDGRLVLMPHILSGRFSGMSVRYAPTAGVLGLIDFASVFTTTCVTAQNAGGNAASAGASPDSGFQKWRTP